MENCDFCDDTLKTSYGATVQFGPNYPEMGSEESPYDPSKGFVAWVRNGDFEWGFQVSCEEVAKMKTVAQDGLSLFIKGLINAEAEF